MRNKRNTLQKRVVFDILKTLHNHPTAKMVYEAVNESFPGVSKATVYRLLAEAADEGKIQRLKLRGIPDRYDVTTYRHCHIVCRECGAVEDAGIDFTPDILTKKVAGHEGFAVDGCHVEFTGLCKTCAEKQTKK